MSAIQAKLAATPSQAAAPPHEPPQPAQAPPIQQSEAPPPPAPAEQSLASTTEDTSKPRWFGDPTADATGATANSAPQPLAPLPPTAMRRRQARA